MTMLAESIPEHVFREKKCTSESVGELLLIGLGGSLGNREHNVREFMHKSGQPSHAHLL